MNWIDVIILLLILTIHKSNQLSTVDSQTYIAGVVEFSTQAYNYSQTTFDIRTRQYIEFIDSPDNVDIIVFPEMTLNERLTAVEIPKPEDNIAPCDPNNTDSINLRNISCAARRNKKYVVINLTMKQNCTQDVGTIVDTCGDTDFNLYNTNVVFDRNGTVISVYRKHNLFGEGGITRTKVADLGIFTTDFGVTFGHFICFDLLFDTPAIELINKGIKNFIFPTMWFSELPFLTAVQVQQNWAHKFNVNLLASGASNPNVGSTGTGIFMGQQGSGGSLMSATRITELIIAEVPKNPETAKNSILPNDMSSSQILETEPMTPLFLKRERMTNYTSKYLDFDVSQRHEFELCQTTDFCCKFSMQISTYVNPVMPTYFYHAVIYDGNRTFDGVADGDIFVCAVVACINKTFEGCGLRFPGTSGSAISFINLNITANIKSHKYIVPMPNTLNGNIMPLHPNEFNYTEIGNWSNSTRNNGVTKGIEMKLLSRRPDILTFGIYGRSYTYNGSNTFKLGGTHLLIITASVLYLILRVVK